MTIDAEIRRVVTTVDQSGKAVVLSDSNSTSKHVTDRNTVLHLLWVTHESPAKTSGTVDRAAIKIGTPPPSNGTIFRIVDFPPTSPEIEAMDLNYMQGHIDGAPKKGRLPRHPLMHRTRSIDYALVLQGEVVMLLDDSEVQLKAGDVLIQQATNHAWVNRSSESCRIAFVLIDAEED